jgi:hypothetical protein
MQCGAGLGASTGVVVFALSEGGAIAGEGAVPADEDGLARWS